MSVILINTSYHFIREARWKIETIISHAKYSENHPNLKRSFSDGEFVITILL